MAVDNIRVPTLEVRGIARAFPGAKALNGVELEAWSGEVLTLMGENGGIMALAAGVAHAAA